MGALDREKGRGKENPTDTEGTTRALSPFSATRRVSAACACACASELTVLRWARKQGCPWGAHTCAMAATNGRVCNQRLS